MEDCVVEIDAQKSKLQIDVLPYDLSKESMDKTRMDNSTSAALRIARWKRRSRGGRIEPAAEGTGDQADDMGNRRSRESTPKTEGCLDVTIKIGKATFRMLKSSFGLLCLLVFYTLLGGWMFSSIEGPAEELSTMNINKTRMDFLDKMLEASRKENWSEEGQDLLEKFELEMHEFFMRGRIPEKKQTWTMLGGVIYSITVYTTIGYGHIAPATEGGRIATVFYALIGIPLCLMVLADLGRLLTRLIKGVLTVIRLYYYRGHLKRLRQTKALQVIERKLDMKDDVDTKEIETSRGEEFNFPVPIAVGILVIYLLGCAAIYPRFEDWSYADSVYFLFISVSTIGFGDLVPRAEDQTWFLLSTLVVFIGLSLVSMIINCLIDFISDLVQQAKDRMAERVNRMGEAIGLDLQLGTNSDSDEAPKAEPEDLSNTNTERPSPSV